jgi:4-alpha-glucanotransferase
MFRQYEFEKQWQKLRGYAAEKQIKIIGDMPLYVAPDSADAWANPEQFFFDAIIKPIDGGRHSSGCVLIEGSALGKSALRLEFHEEGSLQTGGCPESAAIMNCTM